MNRETANKCFAKIIELWPDWTPAVSETEEWLKYLLTIYDDQTAFAAISTCFQDHSRWKRPCLTDYKNIVQNLLRQRKAQNIKHSEPVLHFTIAREKAEPGHIQVGHKYYGKPNLDFRLIEQAAQKALQEEKRAYGGDWIIVYPEGLLQPEVYGD